MLKFDIPDELFQQIVAFLGGDAKLAQWWVDEYKLRVEAALAEALKEQAIVSTLNFNDRHRPVDGLGQCTFRIGVKLNAWLHAYAPGFVYDAAFIKKLIGDNQHLCFVPTVEKKGMIVVHAGWKEKQKTGAPHSESEEYCTGKGVA